MQCSSKHVCVRCRVEGVSASYALYLSLFIPVCAVLWCICSAAVVVVAASGVRVALLVATVY